MTRPMVELTKKGKPFVWSSGCEESFRELKKALVSPDIMGYPQNEGGEFILDTDASDVGIGSVLAQVQDGRERVIAYASRALNKAERNYCITEKELLSARFFIEYFRQYLLGRHFLVRTDHQALTWLFSLKEPRGKIARWIDVLSLYDFEIQYRPGKKQGHCDALSRCSNPKDCTCADGDTDENLKCGPCKKCPKRTQEMMHKGDYDGIEYLNPSSKGQDVLTETENPSMPVRGVNDSQPGPSSEADASKVTRDSFGWAWSEGLSQADLRLRQEEDVDIGPILTAKVKGVKPTSSEMITMSPTSRHYWMLWDILEIRNGILFKQFHRKDDTGSHIQYVVPKSLKHDVMHQMHGSLLSGHFGCKKTKEKTVQRFYWHNLKEDIMLHIRKCDICEADKRPSKMPRAPMGTIGVGAPLDVIAMDYLGSTSSYATRKPPYPANNRSFFEVCGDHCCARSNSRSVRYKVAE